MENPLDILGLKPGDTLETAHKHRNALFLKLHPDKNPTERTQFQKVYNAYETLLNNPELLKVSSTSINTTDISIRTKLTVSIKDFYFKMVKSITLNRAIFCKKCGGLGTDSGAAGLCTHCNGTGKIDSKILELLNKDPTCPICKGSCIAQGKECSVCGGHRYIKDTVTIEFVLDIINYHKKSIILQDVGNQIGENEFGPVIVLLDIIPDSSVSIEDHYFVVHDHVLPVQRIIGDHCTVKVFDRDVPYKIEENSVDAYTIDRIAPGLKQEIRIKYVNIIPKFTRETTALYKKILELEKNYESDFGSIQL